MGGCMGGERGAGVWLVCRSLLISFLAKHPWHDFVRNLPKGRTVKPRDCVLNPSHPLMLYDVNRNFVVKPTL